MNERMEQEMARTIRLLQASMPERRARRLPLRGLAAALAAAVVLCAAGFAYALFNNSQFQAYFSRLSEGPLSPGQYQFLAEKSVGIGQSVTSGGYTVTVESALCDAQNLFLLIRVEAPEGIRFDPEEGNFFFDYVRYSSAANREAKRELVGFSRRWVPLDGGDGAANTITLLMQDQQVLSADSDWSYTGGAVWNFQLADLTLRTGEFFEETVLLAEGGWSFSFPLSEASGQMEFLSAPVACPAVETGTENTTPLTLTSLRLRPFGLTCDYTFAAVPRPKSVDILALSLILKDGREVAARPVSGGGAGPSRSCFGTMAYRFDVPVALEEVAYLVLPDGTRLPAPQ